MGRYFNDEEIQIAQALIRVHEKQIAELGAALEQFMAWLGNGTLVRDVSKDADPNWTLKMMSFISALNNARAAIALAKRPDIDETGLPWNKD